MYFNNCKGNIFTEHNSNNEDLENWYGNRAFFNVYSKASDSETFINSKNVKLPDFRLRINKIIASNDYEDQVLEFKLISFVPLFNTNLFFLFLYLIFNNFKIFIRIDNIE